MGSEGKYPRSPTVRGKGDMPWSFSWQRDDSPGEQLIASSLGVWPAADLPPNTHVIPALYRSRLIFHS